MNNQISKLGALVVTFAVLTGCATAPMKMSAQDTSSLYGSKLTVIYYEPDPFLPMTNTKGAFALLGVAAAFSEGERLVKEHKLVDPAINIKTSLATDLSETYQISDITIIDDARPYESNPEDVQRWYLTKVSCWMSGHSVGAPCTTRSRPSTWLTTWHRRD